MVEYLPARVRRTLQSTLTNGTASPASISGLLRDAIIETDNAITNEFLRLFPEGREGISRLSDREIESRVRNNDRITHPAIRRCMSGSTALLSLVDPTKTQLWVANLGDCRAGEFKQSIQKDMVSTNKQWLYFTPISPHFETPEW